MQRLDKENGMIEFTLDANDVESAIRHFICACHPDTSVGYRIDPALPVRTDESSDQFDARMVLPAHYVAAPSKLVIATYSEPAAAK